MENYSLFMGATAVMKMSVEMAAVSMEKPSVGTSPLRQGAGTETPVPQILASRWRRLWKVFRIVAPSVRVFDAGAFYRRRGGAGGSKGRPHHRVARAQPWPRHPIIWGPQGPPLAALGCSGCFRAK